MLESEDIDDIITVEERICKTEFYHEPFEVILDSGAGDHVANDVDAPGYMAAPSKGSKVGQSFVAAGGHRMKNRGEMALSLKSPDGKEIKTTFQVSDVTRPQWSVARICDAGYEVVFKKDGAKVMTPKGKVICTFTRFGNLYKIRLDLRNPKHQGFVRRGPR